MATPPGTEEVRFARRTDFIGNFLQTASALIFASYFAFGPIVFFFNLALVWLNIISGRIMAFGWFVYFAHMFFYKPHLYRGWPNLVLYTALCDYVLHYYDATCVREGPPPPADRRYVFVVYPHGVYGACRAFSGGAKCFRKLFPGISVRWGSFGAAFYLPGIREFSLLVGCVDAGRPTMERVLTEYQENAMLLPGGIAEMGLTDGKSKQTTLVDRRGFVKLAIETGADIVPSFCFGEKWIHRTVKAPQGVQDFLYRNFRMSGTFLKGRGLTFLGYLGKPLNYVYAAPVKVVKQNPATQQYIDEIYDQVQASIEDVFARYKGRFGYPDDETLVFVKAEDLAKSKKTK